MILRIILSVITTYVLLLTAPSLNIPSFYSNASVLDLSGIEKYERYMEGLYRDCGLQNMMDFSVFRWAMIGYGNLSSKIKKKGLIAIVDLTRPSKDKRFFLIDLNDKKVLYNTLAAHGDNSGGVYAKSFSNGFGTRKTSLGFYVTGETYHGKYGYSLRMDGYDDGFNSNARERAIVIHGSEDINEEYISKHGMLKTSGGCPALPAGVSKEIIDRMKNGSCVLLYHDNDEYLRGSAYLNADTAMFGYLK
ncbi:MAG: murein L,D-transpeptidase catalytic domain family protein [Elusimicrobia bacterium]|nr:murein L,D-transpeptidase catalytic domain family protein [Elusimicrobiota bacterium]